MAGAPPFPVIVSGVSIRSPLGVTARQSALCARARKGEPRSTRYLDKRGRAIGACTSPGIAEHLEGVARLTALALPALRSLRPQAPGAVPVLLALPEPGRADDDPRLDGAILPELAQAAGVALDEARSKTFRAGHAGFGVALAAAVEALKSVPAVIVGAVDSYLHAGVLAHLDEECRVHGIDAENGFVPGEGAAFLSLTRGGAGRVRLRAVENALETSIETGAPNTAQALTRLLAALAPLCPGERIAWALTDVNGERHRVREWDLASMRGAVSEDVTHEIYADDLGDMGAATGAVLAAIAHELIITGAAPAETACVALASDGAARSAFLLGLEGAAQ